MRTVFKLAKEIAKEMLLKYENQYKFSNCWFYKFINRNNLLM
jgi:hypothetical protein